jgi:MarR family transcriptional regulator, 2-MHQ and catechol-resistance regulon repressor
MSEPVSGILERRLQSRPITDPVYRATMNLQVAAAQFEEDFAATLAPEGLSSSALNVLRILRGHAEGHPRGEIARRLIYRNADVTRIIDRLTRRGLVERVRSPRDRRLSLTRLTAKGQRVLARLQDPIEALVADYRRKLSAEEFRELSRLLEALYAERAG